MTRLAYRKSTWEGGGKGQLSFDILLSLLQSTTSSNKIKMPTVLIKQIIQSPYKIGCSTTAPSEDVLTVHLKHQKTL